MKAFPYGLFEQVEIADLCDALGGKEDVGGFDVSMDDPLLVGAVKPDQDVAREDERLDLEPESRVAGAFLGPGSEAP